MVAVEVELLGVKAVEVVDVDNVDDGGAVTEVVLENVEELKLELVAEVVTGVASVLLSSVEAASFASPSLRRLMDMVR